MIFGRRRDRRNARANILMLLRARDGQEMGAWNIASEARVPYIELYRVLDQLLVEGLIADNWEGDPRMRRLYHITDQGRRTA